MRGVDPHTQKKTRAERERERERGLVRRHRSDENATPREREEEEEEEEDQQQQRLASRVFVRFFLVDEQRARSFPVVNLFRWWRFQRISSRREDERRSRGV